MSLDHIASVSKLRLQQKRQLINLIRKYFEELDFFEIETPLLVPSPGMEVHLHGFNTKYIDQHGETHELYLPTSPEFAIKKALGSGFERVFEIARVFRNHGEMGAQHHPEFNMLEWYRPGDYKDIMDDVEGLLDYLATNFGEIVEHSDFMWKNGISRITIDDCFRDYADMNLKQGLQDLGYWRNAAAEKLQEQVPDAETFDDVFFRVWIKLIEPKLGQSQPQIVYDYPPSMAALAKLKEPEGLWAERFELYIQGVEIGNAFSELTDSKEQARRFDEANREREALGYPAHPIDKGFIESVGKMKPSGGIAIGVERLLMVLTGETDISTFFINPLEQPT